MWQSSRFWDLVCQEHAKYNLSGVYDDSMSSFFRHVDMKNGNSNISVKDGNERIRVLKARGLMVDMEEGVIGQIQRSSINELFDQDQIVSSVSGSGNNWAVGYHVYGSQFHDQLLESIRKQTEFCDSLQSFFVLGSMGGGTGSGLGSYMLELLHDHFGAPYKFMVSVVPSPNDDVVTSPYNTILSLNAMHKMADCVLPVDNQSLARIYDTIHSNSDIGPNGRKKGTSLVDSNPLTVAKNIALSAKSDAFATMNNIVANLLLNLTSSMRFEGAMNVDINDIVTNLVPFPDMKYLFSSMTPLYTLKDVRVTQKRFDELFSDAFLSCNHLVTADPRNGQYFASALIVRGLVELSDLRRNVERMRKSLNFVEWNRDGWKTGLCDVPPIAQPHSVLSVSNNTCMGKVLEDMHSRFIKLYKRKANLHHYLDYMEKSQFEEAKLALKNLIRTYSAVNQ